MANILLDRSLESIGITSSQETLSLGNHAEATVNEKQPNFGGVATRSDLRGDHRVFDAIGSSAADRLMNAREVAARLGVSERWVRDHTTRRSPKIRGVKLGTLMRYRYADVEEFMERMTTSRSSLQPRFGG